MWDVVVIGAGVVGCAAARELSKYPLKVLVLEKGPDICSGTSKGNSAMVHAGHDPEPGSLKAKFNVLGNPMFDELCAELEVPFSRTGLITFATNPAAMEKLYIQQRNADQNGVEVHIFDLEGLRELEPGMGDEVIGGLWAPKSGMVCPYNLVIAMAENAAINGVEFRLDTEVRHIEAVPGGYRVDTNKGSFEAQCVLNSAGTHADRLNNLVSVKKLKIIPRQGEHLILDRKYAPYLTATVGPPSEDLPGGGHTKGMGLMPSVDGTIIIGCNAREVENPDDTRSTAAGIDEILQFCENYWSAMPIARQVPDFPADAVIGMFTGVRAHLEGDDYIVGEAPGAPGFYNAAGIESPGLTAGPAIGLHLTKLIAERLGVTLKSGYIKGRRLKKPFREMTRQEREKAIQVDPDYAKIVCRCEQVTEAEVRDAIRRPLGARSISAVKMRTRAGMGRCQGGFCSPKVLQILCEELELDPLDVNLAGQGSFVLCAKACVSSKKAVER